MHVRSPVVVAALALASCSDHNSGVPLTPDTLQVAFETRAEVVLPAPPAGGEVRAADVVFAELDGVAGTDAAVASLDGHVYVYTGDGKGGVAFDEEHEVGGEPIALGVADLDENGSPDLVVVSATSDEAHVLLNRGARFEVAQSFAVDILPTTMVVADCNGDGHQDLILCHLSRSDLKVYMGDGTGQLGPATTLPAPLGAETSSVTVAELTGDQVPEILVCDVTNDRVVMLVGQAGGGHPTAVVAPLWQLAGVAQGTLRPLGLAVGDLTGDGVADVAVTCFDGRSAMVLRYEGGAFVLDGSYDVSGKPALCRVDDVTGDGLADLIACVLDRSSVSIFPGTATGLSAAETQVGATGFPFRPQVVDLDSDGRNDLVVVSGGIDVVNVYRGTDSSIAGSRLHAIGFDGPEFVVAADFAGVGEKWVAAAGSVDQDEARWVRFAAGVADAPGSRPGAVKRFELELADQIGGLTAADVDLDGRPDLLVAFENGIKILVNERPAAGQLAFRQVPAAPLDVLAPGVGPAAIVAEDLNGDGITDLAVSYYFDDRVAVLYGKGSLEFEAPIATDLPGRPFGMVAGDFEGDRTPELAVARNGLAIVTILERTPSGRFEPRMDIPVGAEPNFVQRADLDRDGRTDLVVSNYMASSVTTLVADGAGGFFDHSITGIGAFPTSLLVEDIDRDAIPDILVASLKTSDFHVVLGDGKGAARQIRRFPGVYTATSAALLDLNEDRKPELVIGTIHHKRMSVFHNISVTAPGR